jgi:hypothetical protein
VHNILSLMAKELGMDAGNHAATALNIRTGINNVLWMADKGYYAQYSYGRAYANVSPRFEALGEALAVLFDVADKEKAKSIIAKSPITPYGVTCIYPQIPNIPPYHNNGIWPFVTIVLEFGGSQSRQRASVIAWPRSYLSCRCFVPHQLRKLCSRNW